MKRRVIQSAESTQLVSLPRQWCLSHGIKRGDELEVQPRGNSLLITTGGLQKQESVEVDISKLDRTSILFLIRGLYKKGHDEIKLTYAKSTTAYFRTRKEVNISAVIHLEIGRCPGLEVIEQKENYCVLKAISNADPKELDHILRRTFILISDTSHDLMQGLKMNDRALLETLDEKHDNITKFTNHCLRLINKQQDAQNAPFLSLTVSILDKIVDLMKNTARDKLRFPKALSKNTLTMLEMMIQSYALFHDLYYKFSFEKVQKMSELKERVHEEIIAKTKIIPKEELLLLYEMHQSLELFRMLTEARMALEY